MAYAPQEKGKKMTDKEKLKLIGKLNLNIPIIDFTDDRTATGAGHALNIAIECILEMDGEKDD